MICFALLAAAFATTAAALAQDVQEPPSTVQELLEEVRELRAEMKAKDIEFKDLRERFEELEANQSPSTPLTIDEAARLDQEISDLKERLAHSSIPKPPPRFPKIQLGGQLRWRAESRNNYDFGSGTSTPDDHFVDQRARLQADVEFDEDIHGFIQIQDTRRWGEELSPSDDSADGVDFHQAFLDLKNLTDTQDTLRIGRQELIYGKQRLIAALDWSNQGRSFDAVRWIGELGPVHTEIFASQLAVTRNTTGDYTASEFGGIYSTLHPIDGAKLNDLDLYLLYLHDSRDYQEQNRWTAGARFELETESGFYFETEAALQFGTDSTGTAGAPQVNLDIPFGEVYAVVGRVGYRLNEAEWKPGITFEVNHATGDKDPTDGKDQRFNTLFPLGHAHNGMIDFTFWENTRNAAVRLNASPSDVVNLYLDGWWFWVDQDADAIRGPSFNIPGLAGSRNFAGTEIDLKANWQARPGLSLEAGYALFFPGDHVKDVLGDNEMAQFLYIMLGLKF